MRIPYEDFAQLSPYEKGEYLKYLRVNYSSILERRISSTGQRAAHIGIEKLLNEIKVREHDVQIRQSAGELLRELQRGLPRGDIHSVRGGIVVAIGEPTEKGVVVHCFAS